MKLHEFPRHPLTFGPSPVHPLRRLPLPQESSGVRDALRVSGSLAVLRTTSPRSARREC